MGLDIYVGSLTRYYGGNWETILQQVAKDGGIPVQIVRPNPPSRSWLQRIANVFRPTGPAAAAKAVLRWQKQLSQDLDLSDLSWNEDPTAEYFTDKPAWDCYGALLLWAAYDELRNSPRRATAEGWEQDPAYLTDRQNPASRYRHLVADTEIWIPADFAAPIRTKALTGDNVMVGSNSRVLAELRELNTRTWAADDAQISQWRYDGAEFGAPLEKSARFGFSIFLELCTQSVNRHMPMKLDY